MPRNGEDAARAADVRNGTQPVPFVARESRVRRAAPRRLSRPDGALRLLTPGTQGLRPGLLSVAPAGRRTNETLEPEAALRGWKGTKLSNRRRHYGAGNERNPRTGGGTTGLERNKTLEPEAALHAFAPRGRFDGGAGRRVRRVRTGYISWPRRSGSTPQKVSRTPASRTADAYLGVRARWSYNSRSSGRLRPIAPESAS